MITGIHILLTYKCTFECDHCFLLRRALIDRYPQYLAPRQVYGLEA